MTSKVCDNKSAGMLIFKGNDLVVIERRNYPQAYALPAGHLDGDDSMTAAMREAREETGIVVNRCNRLWDGVIPNPCKREGGREHLWGVYYTDNWSGELKAGDDAKQASWMSLADLQRLAQRTEYFSRYKYRIPWYNVGNLTRAIFGDPKNPYTDPEWQEKMGLEPVWYYILRRCDFQIISALP